MNKRYVMAETFSDKLFKFENKPNYDTELFDLKNGIIIGISPGTSSVNIYAPDENEIYDYIGDISFKLENNIASVNLFSLGISSIKFDSEKVQIPEKSNGITVLSGEIDTKKVELKYEKIINSLD